MWCHRDMISTREVTTEEAVDLVLNAADRCDRCGARAWVRVTLTSGELYFCAHHANRHVEALSAQALVVLDEREYMPN